MLPSHILKNSYREIAPIERYEYEGANEMSTAKRNEMMNLIHAFSGQKNIIPIPRIYIGLTDGDYVKAALLNQILYWSERTDDPDGWFYHSYVEWQDELCLTQYQVTRAIEGDKRTNARTDNKKPVSLKDLGVETMLKKSKKGAPTIHYRINSEIFVPALLSQIEIEKPIINNVHNPIINNVDKPLSTMSIMDYQQTQQSLRTETTTETTTEKKEFPLPPGGGVEASTANDDDNLSAIDEMKLAVKKHLKQYNPSQQKNIAMSLLKRLKGKQADYNIDGDVLRPKELLDFVIWWDTFHVKNDIPLTRPKNMGSVKQWIDTWRNELAELADKRNKKPMPSPKQAPVTPVTPIADEYRESYGLAAIGDSDMPDWISENKELVT